jgi:hypothetical protein
MENTMPENEHEMMLIIKKELEMNGDIEDILVDDGVKYPTGFSITFKNGKTFYIHPEELDYEV